MTVLNYIREQKRKLEERHLGETFLCVAGEEPIDVFETEAGGQAWTPHGEGACNKSKRTAWDILREIDGLKGLNVKERERAYADYCRRQRKTKMA